MSKARAIELLSTALHRAPSAVLSAVPLTGGQSNFTFRCTVASDPREYVVRIYGSGVTLLTNRAREQRVVRLLSEERRGWLETFDDGHVTAWVPGHPLTRPEMARPATSVGIARTLAELHAVRLPDDESGSSLEARTLGTGGTLRQWIEIARNVARNDDRALLDAVSDGAAQLSEGVAECEARSDVPMRWAFGLCALCHNDVTEGNVLLDDATDGIALIDFEHAGVNAVAFDIGNHFCQLMRAPQFPAADYPPLGLRMAFVEAYLRARTKAAPDSFEQPHHAHATAAMLHAADAYSLASHLKWAAWCTVQAALSGIEYDFAGCARNLLACHEARRQEVFPLPLRC